MIPIEKASNRVNKPLSQTFSFKGIDNRSYIINGFVANYDEISFKAPRFINYLGQKVNSQSHNPFIILKISTHKYI